MKRTEIMARKMDTLQDELEKEWKRMHHNASIAHSIPDMRNEYESEMFWNYLGDYVSMIIEELKYMCEEKYKKKLNFYQYGRTGATIAPDDYMRSIGGGGFGYLKYAVWDYVHYDDMQEMRIAYEEGKEVLSMFQEINKGVRSYAKGIGEWWQGVKNDREMDKDIIEHDGKVKKNAVIWV